MTKVWSLVTYVYLSRNKSNPSTPPGPALWILCGLYLYDLPFTHQRRLVVTEVDLEAHAIGVLDDRLDDAIDDFAAVHGDLNGITDVEFAGCWVGLSAR